MRWNYRVTCQQPHLSWVSHFRLIITREREREMGSDQKLETTENATSKPMEDDRESHASYENVAAAHDDGEESGKPGSSRRRHKQRQLPELDTSLDDDESGKVESSSSSSSSSETSQGKRGSSREVDEEIIKELKNIKRQNTITHYLLTASILVTLAWQLSEFSLILKIKQGFSNPLKSIGGAIKGLFNRNQESSDPDSPYVLPSTYLPGLKIPELPHLGFDTSNDDDEDD